MSEVLETPCFIDRQKDIELKIADYRSRLDHLTSVVNLDVKYADLHLVQGWVDDLSELSREIQTSEIFKHYLLYMDRIAWDGYETSMVMFDHFINEKAQEKTKELLHKLNNDWSDQLQTRVSEKDDEIQKLKECIASLENAHKT